MEKTKDNGAVSIKDAPEEMHELEEFALERGAYRAKVFPAAWVAIDERVRMKCQIPLCPHFGRTITCPPNVPTVKEFKKALHRYRYAVLVQTRTPLSGEMSEYDREEALKFFSAPGKYKEKGAEKDDFSNTKAAALQLHKLVNEVEGKAMALGFHYALGLIGGECMLCAECAGVHSERGCRRPFESRPSMEGVGIDVVKTSEKAGLPFDIPPKEEIVWSGLVLVD